MVEKYDPREKEKAVLEKLSVFTQKLELLIFELELNGEVELTYIRFQWESSFLARKLDLRAVAKKMITQKMMANTRLIPYEG